VGITPTIFHLDHLNNNYHVQREIGRGGMGCVYLAQDQRLDRPVAVKFLLMPEQETERQSFIRRFCDEAKAVARLSHPNIVSIYDFGVETDAYYMIMEYVEGRPLSALIDGAPRVPISVAIAVGVQVCSALESAHRQGVIHRDIKPENILLMRDNSVKLTDFGIARLIHQEEDPQHNHLGTFLYSAPEQLVNAAHSDARSDIFSLGVTLYELLVKTHPFEARTLPDLVKRMYQDEPESLRESFFDIPEALDHIIAKALAKQPEQRWQSAAEMGHALSQLVKHTGLQQTLVGSVFTMQAAPVLPPPLVLPAEEPVRKRITGQLLRLNTFAHNLLDLMHQRSEWVTALCPQRSDRAYPEISLSGLLDNFISHDFNGLVQISQTIYGFIHQGRVISFWNTRTGEVGDTVGQQLPLLLTQVELFRLKGECIDYPLLIPQLLHKAGQAIQGPLDSTQFDVLDILRTQLEDEPDFTGYITCRSGITMHCFAYSQGQAVLGLKISDEDGVGVIEPDPEAYLADTPVILHIYRNTPLLSLLNQTPVLQRSELRITYQDTGGVTLHTLLNERPKAASMTDLQRALKQNLQLDLRFRAGNQALPLPTQDAHIIQSLSQTREQAFVQWLMSDFFYRVAATGCIDVFRGPCQAALQVGRFDFGAEFMIHAREGEQDPSILLLAHHEVAEAPALEAFVQRCCTLKTNNAAFARLSSAFFLVDCCSPELLNAFNRLTPKGMLGKAKGWVKTSFRDGFHLFIVEHVAESQRFNWVAPTGV
jgi:serine/threonine protein kinase